MSGNIRSDKIVDRSLPMFLTIRKCSYTVIPIRAFATEDEKKRFLQAFTHPQDGYWDGDECLKEPGILSEAFRNRKVFLVF